MVELHSLYSELKDQLMAPPTYSLFWLQHFSGDKQNIMKNLNSKQLCNCEKDCNTFFGRWVNLFSVLRLHYAKQAFICD